MQSRLKGIRKYHNYTQHYMADLLNISVRQYKEKENGRSQFKADEMFIISRLFKMSIESLFLPTDFTLREEVK